MAVPGVVTKLGSQRVEIAVPSQSKQVRTPVGAITLPDSQWIRVTRWVKPEKLVHRHTRASPEEAARIIEQEPQRIAMDKIQVSERGSKGNLVSVEESVGGERQYLAVPYAEREAAKAAGAKWDWREKLWYIGPDGTRAGLAKWLPENSPAPGPSAPREEFAAVLRELGGDLTGEHPIMDGRPHRMATLDDDRGEKSMFYIAHSDGRPAGYAKNNRSGEETRWKSSAVSMSKEQFAAVASTKIAEREADRPALYERTAERLSAQLETYPALSRDHDYLKAKRISVELGVFQTPKGSMAIPAYDADGKLWSIP